MLAVIMDFQSVIKKKNSTGSFLQFFENIRFKISAIQTALLTIATMLNFPWSLSLINFSPKIISPETTEPN
jgi:hypothetical protein